MDTVMLQKTAQTLRREAVRMVYEGEDGHPGPALSIADIVTEEAYDVPLVNSIVTVAYNTKLDGMKAHCLGNYNFYYCSWNE